METVVIASHDLLIRLAKSQVQARVLRIANKRLSLQVRTYSALFGPCRVIRKGDLQRDRVVPASGYTSTLTSLTAAAMAFLVVFALALSLHPIAWHRTGPRRWNNPQPCAFRPLSDNYAQVARAIEILETTPGVASARALSSEEQSDTGHLGWGLMFPLINCPCRV